VVLAAPATTSRLSLSTCGSSFDTVLLVLISCDSGQQSAASSNLSGLKLLYWNDDDPECVSQRRCVSDTI
jgi:hypothetical protein